MESRGMGSLLRQMEYSKLCVMVVPYPAQGHINPMLQFAQRLVSKKVMVTFVMTEADREDMFQAQDASISSQEIQFETISDGLPLDFDRSKDLEMAMQMLCKMGGLTLTNLIERLNAQGNNISCIVYDSFLPWVPEVANNHPGRWKRENDGRDRNSWITDAERIRLADLSATFECLRLSVAFSNRSV